MGASVLALAARMILACYPSQFRTHVGDDVVRTIVWRVTHVRRRRSLVGAVLRSVREIGALIAGLPGIWRARFRHRRSKQTDLRRWGGGNWGSDLTRSLRSWRRRPGYALIVVITLAFGIGPATAVFTVVNGVLLRPLGFAGAERLTLVWDQFDWIGGGDDTWVHDLQVRALREDARAFEDFAAMSMVSGRILGAEQPVHTDVARVSANFFDLLGVHPILGRTFKEGEDVWRSPWVVLITHDFWTRHFGQDSTVIGKKLVVGFPEMEVIGVLPEDFDYRLYEALGQSTRPELWIPHMIDYGWWSKAVPGQGVAVLGKIAEGVTRSEARADLDRISQVHGERFYGRDGFRYTLTPLKDDIVAGVTAPLAILLGAVGVVLLIAVANLATLALARTHRRSGELAVRHALGASRARLAQQLVFEHLALGVIGGTLGVLLAYGLVDVLLAMAPIDLPRSGTVSLDLAALAFTAGLVILAGLTPGLMPAVALRSRLLAGRITSGRVTESGSARRVRHLLVVSQVALSMVLLAGSGLLVRSLVKLQQVDPGYRTDNTLTFSVFLMQEYDTAEKRDRFFGDLSSRISELPGVREVGATTALPLSAPSFGPVFTEPPGDTLEYDLWPGQGVEPDPARHPPGSWVVADLQAIRAGYFETLDIPLLAGQTFGEGQHLREVIVDETLARMHWPEGEAVGEQLWVFNMPVRVIGVVGHIHQHQLGAPGRPQLYFPNAWVAKTLRTSMMVRAREPGALVPQIRGIVAELDPLVPVADIRTLDDIAAEATAAQRFLLRLMMSFALAGLLLAALGLYGVLSFTVTERRREIAVRMAVGAPNHRVAWLVVGQSLRLVAFGLLLGVAGVSLLGEGLRSVLYQVSPTDPVTLTAAVVGLLGVGLVGAWLPARRALGTDPVVELKSD